MLFFEQTSVLIPEGVGGADSHIPRNLESRNSFLEWHIMWNSDSWYEGSSPEIPCNALIA